jgi:hypothetical protein
MVQEQEQAQAREPQLLEPEVGTLGLEALDDQLELGLAVPASRYLRQTFHLKQWH